MPRHTKCVATARLILPAAAALVLTLGGCGPKTPPPRPLPEVGVVTLAPRSVPVVYEQVGQTAGFREVEVRSRVSGILLKRRYEEGQAVNEGQVLFEIDPASLRTTLDQTRGALKQQESAVERARADRERIEPLFKENAVSRKDYDDANSALESALAGLETARARVREAEINTGYALVTAPISGIAGKEARSEGSLIGNSGDASLLTTIAQLHPIYVNFSFSESEKLQFDEDVKSGRIVPAKNKHLDAQLRLGNGRDYGQPGKLDFADSRIDPRTGTIRARAEFPNTKGEVLPGQFVRIRVRLGDIQNALTVPERAITQQQATKLVIVINDKNIAEARPVKLGRVVDGEVVILGGVKAGERVVVDGLMKARPGSEVKIAGPAAPSAATPAAPSAAASSAPSAATPAAPSAATPAAK